MSAFTPNTEQVCEQYSGEQPPHIGTVPEKRAEFYRWLDTVRPNPDDEAQVEVTARAMYAACYPGDRFPWTAAPGAARRYWFAQARAVLTAQAEEMA